ncbi:EthD family reductase [Spirillospora sp. CA-142024]|uniref:EthD family reductase n=1 Tax=Spirillospora sp. CA-142024 TaxID=3240036 RepID=UPI003D8EB83B
MTGTVDPDARQMARFVVIYDTPSDIEAFERHYNDVHIPLAKQYPGLRRFTRSHEPAAVIGEPCHMVVMLDWDDMASLEAALKSEIGRRTAEDAAENLARYATFRGMVLQLDEI